ncbi:MAG: hypothetical protein KJ950_07515 [Proteobacteria bacterium]|nr:hypothetical protein [Pseudomonadota bacterium]MBU1687091.1 hypothetical protein [Pseudomonadota bacterium]
MTDTSTFLINDCALISIATGQKAMTLAELRNNLTLVSLDSIYHHFWGGLLVPRFEEREFNNDFAGWVRHSLRDPVLAERLAAIDPSASDSLEDLRHELLDLIEERLDENENAEWTRGYRQFEFLRSQLVVFDSNRRMEKPEDLAVQIPLLSTSSIFYHFIDARRRLDQGGDDFSLWLTGLGDEHQGLCAQLGAIDPYFSSLSQLRTELTVLFQGYFGGGLS